MLSTVTSDLGNSEIWWCTKCTISARSYLLHPAVGRWGVASGGTINALCLFAGAWQHFTFGFADVASKIQIALQTSSKRREFKRPARVVKRALRSRSSESFVRTKSGVRRATIGPRGRRREIRPSFATSEHLRGSGSWFMS
ncbi:hypothetical protein EVAR_87871_1 [Eumeta japonica]|uniref:Uncharacterized protein n=1 Tax=Eumeta variegata TaxID=151549 RepID=A0A4C1WTS6_EUMVA|nr:hypothetical protein EVAR_87871_1 [Eumeta japonica]